jgi:hypothetical protein
MEKPLFKDPQIAPTNETIKQVASSYFNVYNQLIDTITNDPYNLVPKWNYYNDGKTWLCKVEFKKKTVFWLSLWEEYFMSGFYFTAKNCDGITKLEIPENIKEDFFNRKPIGKLMPLSMNINSFEQIDHLLNIIIYKKSLK